MTDRYAVIGNPVAHSKSPQIHAAFAQQTGQDMSYERILAPLDRFRETVDEFQRKGGKGASVTVPFKIEAWHYATQRSARAENCGAVNTLCWSGNGIDGDNTDGIGLVRDIESNLGIAIAGKRVLILGAGGAARGVAGDLLGAAPAVLAMANRTEPRAIALASAVSRLGHLQVLSLAALPAHAFDIVINATSASLTDEIPAVPASCFAEGALAYEMVYGKGLTPFLTLAAAAGARTADGLGMLVEQAAEAFLFWRGVRPETAPVLALLRGAAS
jgi:shikimate dehydrogenase